MLKRVGKITAVALGGVAAIVLVGGAVIAHVLRDICENDVVAEYSSPDGGAKVVVFVRNCGATTDVSTQASLLDRGAQLANDAGNLFTADTNHGAAPRGPKGGPDVHVRWLDPITVVLEHHPGARVFRAEEHLGKVDVIHRVLQ